MLLRLLLLRQPQWKGCLDEFCSGYAHYSTTITTTRKRVAFVIITLCPYGSALIVRLVWWSLRDAIGIASSPLRGKAFPSSYKRSPQPRTHTATATRWHCWFVRSRYLMAMGDGRWTVNPKRVRLCEESVEEIEECFSLFTPSLFGWTLHCWLCAEAEKVVSRSAVKTSYRSSGHNKRSVGEV